MNPNAKTIVASATLTLAAAVTGLAVLMAGYNAPDTQDFRVPAAQTETIQNAPTDQAAVQGAAVESAPPVAQESPSTEVGTPVQAPAKTTAAKVASVPSEDQSAPVADEPVVAPRTPKAPWCNSHDPAGGCYVEGSTKEETTAGRSTQVADKTEVTAPAGPPCNPDDPAGGCYVERDKSK